MFLAYIIYYKYMMHEVAGKLIRPSLLIEKSRKEELPAAWLFIYLPYALLIIMMVWIVFTYAL